MKTLKIAAVAAGVVLLAGCGQKAAQKSSTDAGANNANTPKTEQKSAASDVISSIADAMKSGKAMKCDYSIKDKDGNETKMSAYVDGKKYKSDFAAAGKITHMVFDGDATYSWREGENKGMKMTVACAEDLAKNAPKPASSADQNTPAPNENPDNHFDGATNVSCSPDKNVDFSIPSDVTFTDQCEMMKNLQKNMPTLPSGVPTSMPGGAPQL